MTLNNSSTLKLRTWIFTVSHLKGDGVTPAGSEGTVIRYTPDHPLTWGTRLVHRPVRRCTCLEHGSSNWRRGAVRLGSACFSGKATVPWPFPTTVTVRGIYYSEDQEDVDASGSETSTGASRISPQCAEIRRAEAQLIPLLCVLHI